jgi:hypothetical protein
MKLFAQRYTYLGTEVVPPPFGIDAIASHDLQTPLRVPTVTALPQLMPAPTPLASQHSPPHIHASNGSSHAYSQHTSNITVPPAKLTQQHLASPAPPPKRTLPESDLAAVPKRQRRSPPPPRRIQPLPTRRWGSPTRDERRRDRDRSPDRVMVPPSIIGFLSQLPNATAYDGMSHSLSYIWITHDVHLSIGPIFKTDEFLSIIARTHVPSPSGMRTRSRSPPSRGMLKHYFEQPCTHRFPSAWNARLQSISRPKHEGEKILKRLTP